jgi:multiple sugar transport system substrate-binding protein
MGMNVKKLAMITCAIMAMALHAQAEDITLNYWASWTPGTPEETKSVERIHAYEKSHPGIKVNVQVITFGMLHDKLLTAVTGNDAPDVSWGLSEWFGELRQMNALMDLSPYAAKWPDRDSIRANVLTSLTVDGKLLALPQYIGLRAMVYHEDQLKKAGYNEPPKTWNDLLDMAAKVKSATGKFAFGIAGTGVRAPQELIAFLAQNDVLIARPQADGKYKNTWESDPVELKRAAEVFAFYKDMLAKGLIAPDAAGWGWQEEDTNFALGQYAMVIDGPWMQNLATQNGATMGDAKVAPPPYKIKPATFFEVSPLYLFKNSKHPDEAWKFASYILSKEWQEDIRPDNSPRVDVLGHPQWGKGFTDLAPSGVVFPPVALGQITKSMTDSIGRVLIRKEDPKAVATWLAKAINQDLRKSGQLSSK